jgi:hypothetical protein
MQAEILMKSMLHVGLISDRWDIGAGPTSSGLAGLVAALQDDD